MSEFVNQDSSTLILTTDNTVHGYPTYLHDVSQSSSRVDSPAGSSVVASTTHARSNKIGRFLLTYSMYRKPDDVRFINHVRRYKEKFTHVL